MIVGAHESVAGGLHKAFERARIDEAAAMQIFTKNSNSWREPSLSQSQIEAFRAAHQHAGSMPLMAHTSYLINIATEQPEQLVRSRDALVAEVLRSSALGIAYVVLHPGAHLGAGEERGIARVAESLADVVERTETASARILIENTAGQGSCLGHRFEQIAAMLQTVDRNDRLGVCFDTQHAFASGYDLASEDGYKKTFDLFAEQVGFSHLYAFHLNDSKKALGSRVDRHEHIGEGNIGSALFSRLINDARFATIPAVLETEPRDPIPYRDEIALLRSLKQ